MPGQDFDARLAPDDEARLLREIRDFSGELSKALTKRIRTAAVPLAQRMVAEVSYELPRRGGLAYRIAAARGTISTRTGSGSAGVSLGFRKPRVLRYIEQGEFPHPVFADAQQRRATWTWVTQPIRSRLVTQAFERNEQQARAAVEQAVADAAATVTSGQAQR